MKKFRVLALLLALIMVFGNFSFAADVIIGGKTEQKDVLYVSGRSYISGDDLKAFGLTSSVSGDKMTLKGTDVTLVFERNSGDVLVNKTPMTFDGKAFIYSNKAYYPLRFVLETLDYTVGYDMQKRTPTIDKNTAVRFPLTIKDGDLSYTFKAPVKSIVSLAPSITEILFAIGAQDLVVGRTLYCDYPLEVQNIRSVGTLYEPDLEGILDLAPEAVIAATHMNEDVMAQLSKAGIQTITQKSPEKVAEIYTLIQQLGLITNRSYEARALVSTLKAKQNRIENIVASIPKNEIKTVYYVVGTGQKEFTAGKSTFIHEAITMAGVKNVADDVERWGYTLEKLLEHNPNYIIGASYNIDIMKDSANYAGLSAIKNGQLVVVDDSIYSRPGPRIIQEGMKTIIEKIYPKYAYLLQF